MTMVSILFLTIRLGLVLKIFDKYMNRKLSKINLLTAICLILSVCAATYAQKKLPCVAETEKMLVEAEDTETYTADFSKADECVRQNPKSVEALIVRSKVFAVKGNFESALADANKAIELAPQNSDAFYARGFVYDKKYWKVFDKEIKRLAMTDYEKALEINPRNGVAFLAKIILIKTDMGSGFRKLLPDFDRAIEYLTASGNTAELARAYYQRGQSNSLDHLWDDGIKDFTTALKLRPNYSSPLALRATTHSIRTDKPNLDAAIADYTEYLKLKPTDYTYINRADIYERKGETGKAISDYRAALALNPNNYTAKTRLAELGVTATTPTPTPPVSPKQPTAEQFAAEGRRQAAQKDYDGAIKSFSECLRLKPDASACYAFRGYVLGIKGDPAAAKKDFEAAFKLEPNQAANYFIRGMMFTELGNKEEAVKDFRAVLKIDPNNQQAKSALQKLGVQP